MAKVMTDRESVLADLFELAQRLINPTTTKEGKALIVQGAMSMAQTLKVENLRAARTETTASVAIKEERFVKVCGEIAALVDGPDGPALFGLPKAAAKGMVTDLQKYKVCIARRTPPPHTAETSAQTAWGSNKD